MATKAGAWSTSSEAPPGPPVNKTPALPWGAQPGDVRLEVRSESSRGHLLMGSVNSQTASGSEPVQGQTSSEMKGTVHFGTISGIPIRWHYLLPVILGIQSINGFSISPQEGYLMLALYGPVLWMTVLIHELGHALTAKKLGINAEEILIWPLGGLAFISHAPTAKKDLLIAVAGPLTHIPMFIFWMVILTMSARHWTFGEFGTILVDPADINFGTRLCAGALILQVVLFVFNLCIPAYPLDGGRVFVDLMCIAGVSRNRAGLSSGVISLLLGGAICAYGIVASAAVRTIAPAVFIGAWTAWQAVKVLSMLKKGELARHPMFLNYEK